MDTSPVCVYTKRIQNRVCHSEAAEVHVNCVSRDNNNQHMATGVVLRVKRAKSPLTILISGHKCQYLTLIVLSFQFSFK